eukprot:CAMPEP_0202898448 /NCGR_PEP_ID=MMETSP1392-20130828/6969_1 /ASSEMBLY_ACC=CAM_ASM_000868 /TAXON_ID=225041 /ORGANISM="Chlamydomonas chlamydogama, Strain SAG 11-48b" /LENGTH=216 /DNA_ID=CAMNT_0049584381 /DNA_START=145 /DNA_END=795 /DNA_ORIENTATION=-
MAASITAVVKGDPTSNTLGDCPFCHRVLLTLAKKGIPFDYQFVDFANKPAWLIEKSGGKVPVIMVPGDNDLVLADSDKIAPYLEDKYPTPSMKSDVPAEIASKVFMYFRQFLQAQTAEEEAEKKAGLLGELQAANDYLSASGRGPLFGGKEINQFDAAFAPKLYHIFVALSHFKKFDIPLEFAALYRYMAYVQTLPEWKQVDYGRDMIIKGWSKHH